MGDTTTYNDIDASNLFNIDGDSLDPTVKLLTTYPDKHKSSTQVIVMFGDVWVKESAGIEIREINTKVPSFHYSNPHHSGMLKGKTHIEGTLYVYETKTQELLATIAKYKLLLERDNYNEKRIEDIVNSRDSLLTADITSTLITNLGKTQAGILTNKALKLLDGDLLSNSDLVIPKLIVVSGNIDDPNPLIDVYEDVEFNKTTKSVVIDGTTQIRAFTFIGKKRPLRDKPLELIPTEKYILDLPKTITSVVDNFLVEIKKHLNIMINSSELPIQINTNSIMFSGTIPPAITSWGTDLCLSSIKFTQTGIPHLLKFKYTAHAYRDEYIGVNATDLETKLTDKIKRRTISKEINASYYGGWKHLYPDLDYLEYNIDIIARTVPTNKSFAFSWILPPPGIPTTDPYTYMEEDRNRVTGSVLSYAFMNASFIQDYIQSKEDITKIPYKYTRVPIRSLTYVPRSDHRKLESAKENVKEEDSVALQSYRPLHLLQIKDLYDLNVDVDKLSKELYQRINSNANSTKEPIDGIYNFEQWYKYEVGGLFMYNILRIIHLPSIGSGIDSILQGLGLQDPGSSFWHDTFDDMLPNLDKLNFYEDPLPNFPPTSTTAYLNVQVYSLGIEGRIDNIESTPVLGGLFSSFLSLFTAPYEQVTSWFTNNTIDRNDAKVLLAKADCAKTGIKYIWDIKNIGKGTEKFSIGISWITDVIRDLANRGRTPTVLVRVLSHEPEIVLPKGGNTKDNKITKLYLQKHEFISASSHIASSQVEIDYTIRTDRAYYRNEDTVLVTWPTSLLELSERSYINNTNRLVGDWAMSLRRSGTMGNVLNNIDIIQTQNESNSSTSIDTSSARSIATTSVKSIYKYSMEGLQMTLDSVSYAYNVFASLPIISQALSFVNNLTGIDLTTIFTKSLIYNSKDMWLKYLSAYITGYRYTLILDDMIKALYNIFTETMFNHKELMELLDIDSKSALVTSYGTPYYRTKLATKTTNKRTKTLMVDIFTKRLYEEFTRDEYWSVDKLPVKVLSIMGIEVATNPNVKNTLLDEGRYTNSVMILTNRPPRPSPFLVDFTIQGVDYENDPNFISKGINIDA